MQIAIVGTGAIGSTIAYQLSKAGHEVTVVARGARLEQLERDQAIVLASGERAAVKVVPALPAETPFDLVIVSVLAPQVDAVLPALKASAGKTIMFMFNTFDSIDPLREAVGKERATFGFPGGIFALLEDGKLTPSINPGTTVAHESWAKVFRDAGIPTVAHNDMQSWLRSHAAMVAPLMAVGCISVTRGSTWAECKAFARAMDAGFAAVRDVGNQVTPSAVAAIDRMPIFFLAGLIWILSRTKTLRDLGVLGPNEARMLIDQMSTAAPTRAEPLRAIRP